MITQITHKEVIQGKEIIEYSMKNDYLEIRFLNVGGAITKISLAEDGYDKNLVLNYQNLEDYLTNECYLNIIVGRTSNRITNGKFMLNEKEIQVDINSDPHNLHGGAENLGNTFFDVITTDSGYSLHATLPHQENGFPGNLNVTVYYKLIDNKLNITYKALTDQTTIVNLTQHTYFNLSGNLERTIYDHELKIEAIKVAEIDETSGFTKNLIPVSNTCFDFNTPAIIDPERKRGHYVFNYANGYDHLYLLDPEAEIPVIFKDLQSGRTLKITTTEPAMQFYAGNYITDELLFENNRSGEKNLGACFETHKIPFDYESQILERGEVYTQITTFEFSIEL